ncbi:transmembrane protein, putative (macronuclear) [Tetrahymena thermophila SB210]|uniref:Transmembrane protein, putative n=1 Tax=Tetrahymena thermophila (strain SB210) TaxID=312017 RepID=Q23FY0_TETTS|nr:transmembrane protein, putative [Tetrahymena thermophila SB210]EAR95480.2 transmembrane protein, putative [Tetrahymena thermophila SB210]|eukprot:XP_001015725.2 transmembrane protein, putative [Tetrahymena thermophila SB210]
MMLLKDLDLFNSPFEFKFFNQDKKIKNILIRFFFSIILISATISFFAYLFLLYFTNQINPIFQSQPFYTNEENQLLLDNNYFGFQFVQHSIVSQTNNFVQQNNLVFVASILIRNQSGSRLINLKTLDCTNHKLNGYKCIDFQNQELLQVNKLSGEETLLQLRAYRCSEVDKIKTQVTNNCTQISADDFLKQTNYTPQIQINLLTFQYNTTSQNMQNNYKTITLSLKNNIQLNSQISTTKQILNIQKGLFWQEDLIYENPSDYQIESTVYSNFNLDSNLITDSSIALIEIKLDNKIQYSKIKFASIVDIVKEFNSLAVLIVFLIAIGRYFVRKLMIEDIQLVFLRHIYQNTYLNQLDLNQIFRKRQIRSLKPQSPEDLTEKKESINIPSIVTKSRKYLEPFQYISKNMQDSIVEGNDFKHSYILGNTFANNQAGDFQKKDIFENTVNNYINSPSKEPILTNPLQEQILQLSESSFLPNPSSNINQNQNGNGNYNLNNTNNHLTKIASHQNLNKSSKYIKKDISIIPVRRESIKVKNNPLSPFKLTHSIKLKENSNNQQSIVSNIFSKNNLGQSNYYLKTQNKLDSRGDQNLDQNNPQGISQFCVLKLENTESCADNLYALQNKNFGSKLKEVIFKIWNKPQKKGTEEWKKTENLLKKQVEKNLDILQIYKDLIILKKAIMLLLSKEQYAALLLTGCSINQKDLSNPQNMTDQTFKNLNDIYTQTIPQEYTANQIKGKSYQQIMYESQHNKMMENYKGQQIFGHLDEQFQIYESEKWQLKYLKQFIMKCKDSQNLSELDKRILSSLTL